MIEANSNPSLNGRSPPQTRLGQLDDWASQHPWHPRVAPWGVYLAFLMLITYTRDLWPPLYPLLYTAQCLIVVWILWRYRRMTPELTLHFHWLALPVGLGVAGMWIAMGLQMADWFPQIFGDIGIKPLFNEDQMGPEVGWIAMALRGLGMSLVVPMFEEMFNRSLLLRSLSNRRLTIVSLTEMLQDVPMIGDWLMHTKLASAANQQPATFGTQFEATPLGRLTLFGVVASTLIFVSVHHPRDWPACFLCGVIYCLVLAATHKKGLGPVIWTHGITNAALWGYTLYQHYHTAEGAQLWQFL